jgi:hypothetical protein
MLTLSSISFALLWTAGMLFFGFAGALGGAPPDTPRAIALFVGIFLIAGALAGLYWHRAYGAWFREYFELDPEYRRIDRNSEVPRHRTGRWPWLHNAFGASLIFTAIAFLGLAGVHYLPDSCRLVGECLGQASFFGNLCVALVVLRIIVSWIERLIIGRRRLHSAESGHA